MPEYLVTVPLSFVTTAPNTTEAKARIRDMNITELLKGRDLGAGLIYRRRGLVTCEAWKGEPWRQRKRNPTKKK